MFGLVSLIKFVSIVDPANLLHQTDPVFDIPILYVVAGASLVECYLCVYISLTVDIVKIAWAAFAFANVILAYRVIALTKGITYCPCLGNVANWWPWLGRHEGPIMTSIAIWLFLTSALQLISERKVV